MKGLTQLKQRLLGQKSNEQETVYSLCAVMEKVGGYEQLMNLPMSALNEVLDYLEHINKPQKKGKK